MRLDWKGFEVAQTRVWEAEAGDDGRAPPNGVASLLIPGLKSQRVDIDRGSEADEVHFLPSTSQASVGI